MNYQILPMTGGRLPQVAALEKICFPADPWSEELFRAALDNPNTSILLAEGEDRRPAAGGWRTPCWTSSPASGGNT